MKLQQTLIALILLSTLCACQERATPHSFPSSFEELSEQGRALCRKGNYLEGLTLLQAANDSLATMHPDSINPDAAVMFMGNLANLYIRMNLFEEAKQINSSAIAIADEKGVSRLPELWGMRGIIYEHTGQSDSVIICLNRHLDLSKMIEDSTFRANVIKRATERLAWFYIENPDYAPDSIPTALATLERLTTPKNNTTGGTDYNPTNQFLIGRGYSLLGNHKQGIPLMEKALKQYKIKGDTESVEWALQLLAKSYAAAGDRKLIDIYAEASDLHDTIMQRQHDNVLLGVDFKYRATELKQENTILQNELLTKKQKIIYIAIISFLIFTALILFSFMHIRNNRRQLTLKQQNIDTLLEERIALNARIEEMNKILTENNLENKRHELLQSIILEKDDEKQFRKSFNDLHPGFIDRLRREYPEITSGNELLCMLIALKRRNEEIALALGISRESVATSRYRLRNRFNLSKETDLNDFIQSKL